MSLQVKMLQGCVLGTQNFNAKQLFLTSLQAASTMDKLDLQVAEEAFKTAKDHLPALKVHKERCTILHKRSEALLQLHEVQELATRGNPDKNNLINAKVETLRRCVNISSAY